MTYDDKPHGLTGIINNPQVRDGISPHEGKFKPTAKRANFTGRCSQHELEKWQEAAKDAGKTYSEWAREVQNEAAENN